MEIEDGVFVEPDKPTAVAVEAELGGTDNDEETDEDTAAEETNFACPSSGLHLNPTSCADYYQCTETNKVRSH